MCREGVEQARCKQRGNDGGQALDRGQDALHLALIVDLSTAGYHGADRRGGETAQCDKGDRRHHCPAGQGDGERAITQRTGHIARDRGTSLTDASVDMAEQKSFHHRLGEADAGQKQAVQLRSPAEAIAGEQHQAALHSTQSDPRA